LRGQFNSKLISGISREAKWDWIKCHCRRTMGNISKIHLELQHSGAGDRWHRVFLLHLWLRYRRVVVRWYGGTTCCRQRHNIG